MVHVIDYEQARKILKYFSGEDITPGKIQHEALLLTGAKIARRKSGRKIDYVLYGYAADGSDIQEILEIVL